VPNTVILHDAARSQWLSFREPARVLEARQVEAVLPALREAEALVNEGGLYAAGFISYEAAPACDASFRVRPAGDDFPLLWFGLYSRPAVVAPPPPGPLLEGVWTPSVTRPSTPPLSTRSRLTLPAAILIR
jgi:para-aminobenzoate synthetase / 4-amino-4-deoxychorismate lyase